MTTPKKFTLTIQATPNAHPGVFIRLRQVLKALLRSYGFRCIDIAAVPEERTAKPQGHVHDGAGGISATD